jgi:leader peptidase (prepilin peptidase)/N-methyltransferase
VAFLEGVIVALFALAFGSFATVLGTRVPANEAITGRSRCRLCGAQLEPRDNIPLLSYLANRGKCRHCDQPYGSHYLIGELTALAAALIAWFTIEPLITRAAWLALAVLAAALMVSDLTLHRLPNPLVFTAGLIGLGAFLPQAAVDQDWDPLLRAMTGSIALFLIYLALNIVSRGGMGAGDVKLAGVLGLYLAHTSWWALYIGTAAAFIAGGAAGALLLLLKRANRKSALPFGPFMLMGAFVALLFA